MEILPLKALMTKKTYESPMLMDTFSQRLIDTITSWVPLDFKTRPAPLQMHTCPRSPNLAFNKPSST